MPKAAPDASLPDLHPGALTVVDASGVALRDWVECAEAWRIAKALREARGNRSAAARALGIGRRTLYSKLQRLGMTLPDARGFRRALSPWREAVHSSGSSFSSSRA